MASASSSWGAELREYERAKRHQVDPALLVKPPPGLTRAIIFAKERQYDSLQGRFRDDERERQQRTHEETEMRKHLNRAMDVQLRREARHNLLTFEQRYEPIQARCEAFHPGDNAQGEMDNPPMPASCADHNIISNLPLDVHHWDHPERRPRPLQQAPKGRFLPRELIKEFNVLTNRYVKAHDEKTTRDNALLLLEAAEKHRRKNVFDPVTQRFTDPRVEQRMHAAEDAKHVQEVALAKALQPLCERGRETEAYDMISHQVKDDANLRCIEAAELSRTRRYQTRHRVDQETRVQAEAFDDAAFEQMPDNVSHERFEETVRRGYNIVTGREFGLCPHQQLLHQPYTKTPGGIMDKIAQNRIEEEPLATISGGGRSAEGGSSARAAVLTAALKGDPVSSQRPAAPADVLSLSGARSARGAPRAASSGFAATAGSVLGGGSCRTPLSARSSQRAPPAPTGLAQGLGTPAYSSRISEAAPPPRM